MFLDLPAEMRLVKFSNPGGASKSRARKARARLFVQIAQALALPMGAAALVWENAKAFCRLRTTFGA
jgi:hypothetical protein